jgi:hypothetical protein
MKEIISEIVDQMFAEENSHILALAMIYTAKKHFRKGKEFTKDTIKEYLKITKDREQLEIAEAFKTPQHIPPQY